MTTHNSDNKSCCAGVNRENVFGVTMKGGVMAKITNADKFSNWSWWIGITPSLKSTVFVRPAFHLLVWMYIAVANLAYFVSYPLATIIHLPKMALFQTIDSFVFRLLTWLLATFVSLVVATYYKDVRKKASAMIMGLDGFVDGISISVDYESPRAAEFLNELYGAVHATSHFALALASENTRFKLSKDEIQAIFDDNGYDGNYLLSFQKKQIVTIMRVAIQRSLKEEKESSNSCLKDYNEFREEQIWQDLRQFASGAMSVTSCVSCNKLPFAYVQLITWATRVFLFYHLFFFYASTALEHVEDGSGPLLNCFSSIFYYSSSEGQCDNHIETFVVFNIVNITHVYFVLGLLELYPVLIKSWQSQLVLKNYRLVIDGICGRLKPDEIPKNLFQLKKCDDTEDFNDNDERRYSVSVEEKEEGGY